MILSTLNLFEKYFRFTFNRLTVNMSRYRGRKRKNSRNAIKTKRDKSDPVPLHPIKYNALKLINDQLPNSDEFMVEIHRRTNHLMTTLSKREDNRPQYVELVCSTLGRIGRSNQSDLKRDMHQRLAPLMTEDSQFFTTIARFLLQQQENYTSKLSALESLAAFISIDEQTISHPFLTALRLHRILMSTSHATT